MPPNLGTHYLGVDVGTGSARAGVFDEHGKLVGLSSSPIQIWKEAGCVEQSSADIWLAVCAAVKAACKNANLKGTDICGIGFAATCSLVAVDSGESPVTVSLSRDAGRNIIVWMDHRAMDQAERINASGSPVLQFVGGGVSPEMQPPKLLWVKENLKESWAKAFRWMDLSDWLTFRATGDDTRSLCTTVCKWTYQGHAHQDCTSTDNTKPMDANGWDDLFWKGIGLGDLVDGHYSKIGTSVAFPGTPLGTGLTALAAQELGLVEGTPVGTSVIDAHAGGIGVMESIPQDFVKPLTAEKAKTGEVEEVDDLSSRMVLVCGTSTCHMAVTKKKVFIPGVWGPYWSAMIPDYWLFEGGQSATGALLEHLVESHSISPALANKAALQKISVYEILNNSLDNLSTDSGVPFRSALTQDVHVLPDFHGNRSPYADPKSKGMVSGMTLDSTEVGLSLVYLASVQSIAYGTRQIVERLGQHGLKVDKLIACGGLSRNRVYLQEHADILGCPVVLPREAECVLLGASILGAVAAKKFVSISSAMGALNAPGLVVQQSKDARVKKYHDAKYKIFQSLYEQQLAFRDAMTKALA
ncbi:unnamed protein product [Calypogeia fissa]